MNVFKFLGITPNQILALSSNEKMVQKILKKKLKLEDRIERKKAKKEQKTKKKKRQNMKISEAYVKSEDDPIEISEFDSKVFAAPYYDPEMATIDPEMTLSDPEIEHSGDFDNNSTREGSGASENDQIIVDLDLTSVDPVPVQHVPEPRIRVGPNFLLPVEDEPLSRRPQIKLLNNADRPFTDIEVNLDQNGPEETIGTEIGTKSEKISMSETETVSETSTDSTALVLRTNNTLVSQPKNNLARSYDYLKFSALAALKAKYYSNLKLKQIMSLPVNEDKKDKLLASYQGISTSQKLVSRFQRFPDGDGKLTCFTCHEKTMEECYAKGKMVHCWESDACT